MKILLYTLLAFATLDGHATAQTSSTAPLLMPVAWTLKPPSIQREKPFTPAVLMGKDCDRNANGAGRPGGRQAAPSLIPPTTAPETPSTPSTPAAPPTVALPPVGDWAAKSDLSALRQRVDQLTDELRGGNQGLLEKLEHLKTLAASKDELQADAQRLEEKIAGLALLQQTFESKTTNIAAIGVSSWPLWQMLLATIGVSSPTAAGIYFALSLLTRKLRGSGVPRGPTFPDLRDLRTFNHQTNIAQVAQSVTGKQTEIPPAMPAAPAPAPPAAPTVQYVNVPGPEPEGDDYREAIKREVQMNPDFAAYAQRIENTKKLLAQGRKSKPGVGWSDK